MLALLAASTAQFTFRSALEGEWELERTKQGAIVRARYSLRGDGPRALEGDYFEEGADGGVEKSMRVRVDFSDDNAGDFQIARLAAPPPADADEAPVPEPALKTAFSFDFAPLHGGRYLLSETPRKGGIVQFMMRAAITLCLASTRRLTAARPLRRGRRRVRARRRPARGARRRSAAAAAFGAAGRGCSCRRSSSWRRGRRSRANELRARIRVLCSCLVMCSA